MKIREKLENLGKKIERMNQIILVFPLWITVGISGIFRNFKSINWEKSNKNKKYEKMY